MIEIKSILDVKKYVNDIDVVIFDLDDTLYSETEYVRSGFEAIAKQYPNINHFFDKLWKAFKNGEPAIDKVLKDESLLSEKEKCLEIYRNHFPAIHLYSGVKELLEDLKVSKRLGLITDGRLNGQRNKIDALSIEKYFEKIIITDELGGPSFRKPNEKAFVTMKDYFNKPYERMAYVGDNLNKDFIAPSRLGMKCIYFNNEGGLYN